MLVNEVLYGKKVSRTRELSVEEFKNLYPQIELGINKFLNHQAIYRGTRRKESIIFTDPTTEARRSANTFNYYTLLMSSGTLPSWKNWPQRDRSLICSGNVDDAAGYAWYGDPFVVLPIGNPKIAICPAADFWDSFPLQLNNLNGYLRDYFNNLVYEFNDKYDVHIDNELKDDSLESLLLGLHHLDQMVDSDPELAQDLFGKMKGYYHEHAILDPIIKSGNIIAGLNNLLDPRSAGFKLIDYADFTKVNKEVWFSAPAVLIRKEPLYEILREIR